MSDNPADSLRRELEVAAKAAHRALCPFHACRHRVDPKSGDYEIARAVLAAVTPLIRAQAFTEAADKIEAIHRPVECANLRCKVGMFCAVCQEAEEEIGCKWPCDSVAVVRGLGEETENA